MTKKKALTFSFDKISSEKKKIDKKLSVIHYFPDDFGKLDLSLSELRFQWEMGAR